MSEIGHQDQSGADARLARELEHAKDLAEQRATFLATMSHELREPMNGVLGMARLLRDTPLDQEQSSYVEAVVDSAQSLITIINDILDLSRIDAGKLELVDVDFSIPIFFERLGLMLETRARAKDLPLELELADGLPEIVRGDPGRLRQILVNLAGNAIKFTDQGHVRVKAAPGPDPYSLVLSVQDTGMGIPPELRDRLFTAFAQADSTTPRLFGGSGLGLMIAQRLVQAMGGNIAVESEAGRGTEFAFCLNLGQPASRGDASVNRARLAGASLLVVDPQVRSRELVCELVQMWQMQARGVSSAQAARTALAEAADRGAPFDMILIDRSLPDESGDHLGETLRHDPGNEGLKMMLMVASGMRGDAARAQASGFDAYLPKPLTPTTLLDALQQTRAGTGQELITIHSVSETKRSGLKLLIVDDNQVNCKLASIMLSKAGHEVDLAHNGQEALDKVNQQRYNAILMDIQMPVMNGIEAAKRIRALEDPDLARIPIIAITANAMPGEDRPCLDAGMNAYVTKPIDRATLLAEVDKLVA